MYSVDPLLYRCPSGFGPSTKLSENIILDVLVELIYVPVRTKVCFRFKTCNWRLEMTLRDSRTPLDSIGDKLLTPIYFVIVQCLSVGTTWYSASCTRNWLYMSCEGYKTALEGEWFCIVCRPPSSRRLRNF